MNFPDWAPPILVKLYEHYNLRRGYPSDEDPVKGYDPDQHFAQLLEKDEKFKQMSKQRQENYRISLYQSEFCLPQKEGKELLGQLLTDLRMKAVWASLRGRINSEGELLYFWNACERAILGWSGAQKHTKHQHRNFFLTMRDHALELFQMMNETEEFNDYSIGDLADFGPFQLSLELASSQIEDTKVKDEIKVLSRYFADTGPSIYRVLDDIATKALQYSEESPKVPKPNSRKAAVHYFVRILSPYLKKEYGQPLHEVVAGTAGEQG